MFFFSILHISPKALRMPVKPIAVAFWQCAWMAAVVLLGALLTWLAGA